MKILHTADWHLGATLLEQSREEDHRHFLDWLGRTLREEGVELLIVAGDVFDSPAPSAEAQALYYGFLHSLAGGPLRQVVVVGGNHDSPSRLDAPRELLGAFGVHVVGGLGDPRDRERCLCPVRDAQGGVQAVVAAVPFAHEWRLGYRGFEGDEEAQRQALGAPFKTLYRELADQARERWPQAPLLATGHLALVGSARDEAPQEIHLIGTLGGLPGDLFDPRYAYVALGHIHRAYQVGGTRAWYSGSPIALNAKEGRRPRSVNLVELDPEGNAEVRRLEVPGTRQVIEVSGTLEEVLPALASLSWQGALRPMAQVELLAETYTPGLEEQCRAAAEALERPPLLLEIKQTFRPSGPQPSGEDPSPQRLQDLEPRAVFRMLCQARGESHEELQGAFEELMSRLEGGLQEGGR